jgi:hypothetical protein
MMQRFLSRKFIVALSALIVALLVILRPQKADEIDHKASEITALVVAVLTAGGYIGVEGAIDKKALDGDSPPVDPSAGGGK